MKMILSKIEKKQGEDEKEIISEIICKKENWKLGKYSNSYFEYIQYDQYKYICINDVFYEIFDEKNLDDYDVFEASIDKDGVIDYLVRYYDGGCSKEEAIGAAVKQLEERYV